jgi:DNA mismatch repair ATPase MutL
MNVLERGEAPSQRLLFPATLHLGPAEGDAFESNREALTRLGFEVEPFGGHSIIVSAVPMPHPRFDALRCLRDTLDALTGDRLPSAAARHERLAATVACKAAIKAGDALSPGEMRALDSGTDASQHLLFPATLHLGPAEADAFESNREAFQRLGFEIELFGGHTLLVSSVPVPHPRFDALQCLRDTLDALTGDRVPSTAAGHERLAATVACKAAIKAGDVLSPDEMRALFLALARTTLPAHDVHGRSTIVQLSWDELDRCFGRH